MARFDAYTNAGANHNHKQTNEIKVSAEGADSVTVPSADFIRDADMTRDGHDLVLETANGETIVIEGYFLVEPAPSITSPEGLQLTPDLVDAFVKNTQFAQTGTISDVSPVGAVEEVSGEATVTRQDGSVETIQIGTPIFQGDVIETNGDGAVSITFIDETSFAVSEDARMAIDEYVFDPSTMEGSQNFSVLKGVFVFTSGLIGREDPDDVTIDTPTGSIGIRGTIIAGDVNKGEITVVEGAIVLRDFNGNEVTLANQFETARFSLDSGGIEPMGQMSAADVAGKFASVAQVNPTLFSSINDAANDEAVNGGESSASDSANSNDASGDAAAGEPNENSASQGGEGQAPAEAAPAETATEPTNGAEADSTDSDVTGEAAADVLSLDGDLGGEPASNGTGTTARGAGPQAGTGNNAGAGPNAPPPSTDLPPPPPEVLANGTDDGFDDGFGDDPATGDPTTDPGTTVLNLFGLELTPAGSYNERINIGDFNNDRFDDFVVGDPFGDDAGTPTNTGQVTIISGANPNEKIVFDNLDQDSETGFSVAAAGDIDGDGYADLIFGAPAALANSEGRIYTVLGGNTNFENPADVINAGSVSTSLQFLDGGSANGRLGSTVAGLGDFENSGVNFFASFDNNNNSIELFSHSGTAIVSEGNITNVPVTAGDRVEIIGGGDIDGDNFSDLIVAHGDFEASIIFGNNYTDNGNSKAFGEVEKTTISSSGEYSIVGGNFVGDINGDGIDDFALAFQNGDGTQIAVIHDETLFSGGDLSVTDILNMSPEDVTLGFIRDYTGPIDISGGGDIDGDGLSDVIINAEDNNVAYELRGAESVDSDINFIDGSVPADMNSQSFVGYTGNDTLDDFDGTTVYSDLSFNGGDGDDRFIINADGNVDDGAWNHRNFDGGDGIDTLQFTATVARTIDLGNIERLSNIETIDLASGGANTMTLQLSVEDVFRLDSSNFDGDILDDGVTTTNDTGYVVRVNGDANDVVDAQNSLWNLGTNAAGDKIFGNSSNIGDSTHFVLIDADITENNAAM